MCSVTRHNRRLNWPKTQVYEHLFYLELADSSTVGDGIPIGILIGSDFYWQFMTGETQLGMYGGPIAFNTHLGWV